MSDIRYYSTKRQAIVQALADALKEIDGTGNYNMNLFNNVEPRLLFWDEINEFPAINVTGGNESIAYQGGGYKDRFFSVTVRCYVEEENAAYALDALMEDVETVVENNATLKFTDKKGVARQTQDITLISIETDEGALEPVGVGEMLLQVRY